MGEPSPQEADRLARQVLKTRLGVKPGENVTIEVYTSSLPWANGFVREARRLGARPLVLYEDEASFWAAVEDGKARIIGDPGSHEWATLSETDVYVYFWGPEDQGRMERLPDKTFDRLVAFNPKWYDRAGKAGVRGVRMGIARAIAVNAKRWGVSLNAWRRELLAASMLDPRPLTRDAEKLRKALEGAGEVRVRHSNGTDLSLRLVHRKAISAVGIATPASIRGARGSFMASVPDGCVYVSVDETTAEGTVVANRMAMPFATPVRGGKWTFRGGRLVGQRYEAGSATVKTAYAAGKEGRDRPGMLEVGLDPTVHMSPGLQENERGAVSIGIGSNVGFGGRTNAGFSAILTVAGAELTIDDRIVVRRGRVL